MTLVKERSLAAMELKEEHFELSGLPRWEAVGSGATTWVRVFCECERRRS